MTLPKLNRPGEETLKDIITKIHQQLGKPVMADVDTIESAIAAGSAGADIVSTTLFGYTTATKHLFPPGFTLLSQMLKELDIPVFCEGDISSPQMACQALELGAYAVVVGTAITGVDFLTKAYAKTKSTSLAPEVSDCSDVIFSPFTSTAKGVPYKLRL